MLSAFTGLAPGANGAPAFLLSGVLPVFFHKLHLEVMIKIDCLAMALWYIFYCEFLT